MSKPIIDVDECIGCGVCVDTCPSDVLDIDDNHAAVVDEDSCVACGACMDACPVGAITEIEDQYEFLIYKGEDERELQKAAPAFSLKKSDPSSAPRSDNHESN